MSICIFTTTYIYQTNLALLGERKNDQCHVVNEATYLTLFYNKTCACVSCSRKQPRYITTVGRHSFPPKSSRAAPRDHDYGNVTCVGVLPVVTLGALR